MIADLLDLFEGGEYISQFYIAARISAFGSILRYAETWNALYIYVKEQKLLPLHL